MLEKTLKSPLDCKEINQSILKEINPKYSLEGLKLKRQYFDNLMQRPTHQNRPWCWERLKAKREKVGKGQHIR